MTTNDPDQIRANIERTRSNLSEDVNTLAEQIRPANVARRQAGKVGGSIVNLKGKVMGSAPEANHSAGSSMSSTAHSVTDSMGSATSTVKGAAAQAPHQAVSKTQGNPLAAGIVAFGVGMLVSSLLPATEKERQAAVALKDKATPLTDEVTAIAKKTGEHLKAPSQEAAHAVRSAATDAVSTVKDEGTAAAHGVRDTAGHATTQH